MKKVNMNFFIRIAMLLVIVLLIIGLVLLITNDHSVNDTIVEIIAFTIGVVGVTMAITSQVTNSKKDRDFVRMERNINKILEANRTDLDMSQIDLEISQKILREIRSIGRGNNSKSKKGSR